MSLDWSEGGDAISVDDAGDEIMTLRLAMCFSRKRRASTFLYLLISTYPRFLGVTA